MGDKLKRNLITFVYKPSYLKAFFGFLILALIVTGRGLITGEYFASLDIVFANSPVLLDGGAFNSISTDSPTAYTPLYHSFFENLKHGNFQEYRVDIAMGAPMIFFYLGRFLWAIPLLFLPTTLGINVNIALMLIFTGLFMYLFLFKVTRSGMISFIGGVAWMLSSHQIAWLLFPMHNTANLYLPLLLLFSYLLMEKFSYKYMFWLLLSGFLFLTAGYIQLASYVFISIAVWNLLILISRFYDAKTWKIGSKNLIRIITPTLVLILLVLLTSGYLYAYFEIVSSGLRGSQEAIRKLGGCGICNPTHFILHTLGFFSPDIWGNRIEFPYFGPANIVEYSRFAGILTMLGLFLTPFISNKRNRFHALSFLIVSLLFFLLMGSVPPFSTLFNKIPFISLGSVTRMVSVVLVMLVSASFIAFAQFKLPSKLKINKYYNLSLILIVTLMIVVLSVFLFPTISIDNLLVEGDFINSGAMSLQNIVFESEIVKNLLGEWKIFIYRMILYGALSVIIFITYIYYKSRTKPKEFDPKLLLIQIVILIILIGDLGRFAFFFNNYTPSEYDFPEFVGYSVLKEDPEYYRVHVVRDSMDFFPSNILSVYGIDEVAGYDTTMRSEYIDFYQGNFDESGLSLNGILWGGDFYTPALEVMNVKYIISRTEPDQIFPLTKVFSGDEFNIYKLNNYKKRLYSTQFVSEGVFEENNSSNISYIESSLPSEINTPMIENIDNLVVYTEGVKTNVSDIDGGLLVFSQMYDDHWKAFVDDDEVEIVRVNEIMMGIVVSEGNHEIEFRYGNDLLTNSSAILGSLFICLGVYLLYRFRQGEYDEKDLLLLATLFILVGLILIGWLVMDNPVDTLLLRK